MAESTFNNLLSLLYIQELKEQYIEGGPTEVAITEVDVLHRRFVCSEALAVEHRTLRGIKCVLFSLLYSTLLYSTLLYSTLLYSTLLDSLRFVRSLLCASVFLLSYLLGLDSRAKCIGCAIGSCASFWTI